MADTIIPIGPFHPLLEEPEFFTLKVEGEKVVSVDVRIGYNHRGIEKLCESKTYEQGVFVVERICGICSTSHPFAYVLAAEDVSGVKVPLRANYIRTIIGEMERIHSHLLWVGLAGHFIGYNTVFMWAWKNREPVLDMFERITGNRNHYCMFKVGGVRRDIKQDDIPDLLKTLQGVDSFVAMLTDAVLDDPVLKARLANVGVLKKEDAVAISVVGPVARASGVDIDVRRDHPYAAYDRVDWKPVVGEGGDVLSKAVVRLKEIRESISIVRQCLRALPKGPIEVEVRDVPKGEGIGTHEAPRGEVIHYIRSNGSNYPERVKIRAPSFMNVPSFAKAIIGESISDAALILAAADPCYCCTERMAAVDLGSKVTWDGDALISMCRKKTEKLRSEMR